METKKKNFLEGIKKIKGLEFIIIGIIAFLAVILLINDGFSTGKKSESDDAVTKYVTALEDRLSETLSAIDGAGKVRVCLTVSGSNKTIIATDVKTVKNGNEIQITETPVLVGGKIVVLSEDFPEITGVIIVATGASNLSVKMDLMNAASTLLSIDSSKIQILNGK